MNRTQPFPVQVLHAAASMLHFYAWVSDVKGPDDIGSQANSRNTVNPMMIEH